MHATTMFVTKRPVPMGSVSVSSKPSAYRPCTAIAICAADSLCGEFKSRHGEVAMAEFRQNVRSQGH
eukprot:266674-Chlamydomonas_euryale.AAC.2